MAKDKKADKSKAEPVEETKAKKNKAEKDASGKAEKSKKGKSKVDDGTLDEDLDDPDAGGDRWNIRDALGDLLVIKPVEYVKAITFYERDKETGEYPDGIYATVLVVNEKKAAKSEVHHRVLISNRALVPALKEKVGKSVAARLVQGEKKGTKSAPFLLDAADADEKEAAIAAIRAVL